MSCVPLTWRHTTRAAASVNPSSHTDDHVPSHSRTSRRPCNMRVFVATPPLTKRTNAAKKGEADVTSIETLNAWGAGHDPMHQSCLAQVLLTTYVHCQST